MRHIIPYQYLQRNYPYTIRKIYWWESREKCLKSRKANKLQALINKSLIMGIFPPSKLIFLSLPFLSSFPSLHFTSHLSYSVQRETHFSYYLMKKSSVHF